MDNGTSYETTNINIKWLENIYEQISTIQNMERLAREGCSTLMDYMQIPVEIRSVVLADVEYKNLRFMALEMDILINNLAPILGDKVDKYNDKMAILLKNIDTRNLFLKEIKRDNQVVLIEPLPFLPSSVNYLTAIKSELIKDIGYLLFIPEQDKNKKNW